MHLYRIARTRHAHDLSGTGAHLYGGRWNRRGTVILYTSPTRALATVEYLVHVPIPLIPADLSIATIEVPDNMAADKIAPSILPRQWRQHPSPPELAAIGTKWAQSPAHALLLKVPSRRRRRGDKHTDRPSPFRDGERSPDRHPTLYLRPSPAPLTDGASADPVNTLAIFEE